MHPSDPVRACVLLCLRARWQPAALLAAQRLVGSPSFDWPAWASLARWQHDVAELLT